MCGLVGFLSSTDFDWSSATQVLQRMTDAVKHRGPDDAGLWIDQDAGFALGHRRLAILDLSAAGHQPMLSAGGRFVLAFNGEIYNHLDLRRRLNRTTWRGHSDTETLLAAIEELGLERTLRASVGMFALALWDRDTRKLALARDRMGEKPLYYGWQGRTFLFGSELKALQQHPRFVATIDRTALASYMRAGYIQAPSSIFEGIAKVMPGSIVTLECANITGGTARSVLYWSLEEIVNAQATQRFSGSCDEAVGVLESLLLAAVRCQQLSDVPLGAFLSGGVDSSTIVALMQTVSSIPTKTFSIGFDEEQYDEARHARAVANHLRTEHTELCVTARAAMDVIPELPSVYDEPFADPSQIPTLLVARLARRYVTVALSGDGGDELFAGYGRYAATTETWDRLSMIPLVARSALRALLPVGPLREGIATRNVDAFYLFTNSQWKGYPDVVLGRPSVASAEPRIPDPLVDPKERMMYADAHAYLPDDILVKVDRAAMSTSLETRVPLLDHRVVEFAWQLPIEIKTRDGIGKWPLKKILYKYVPERLVNRPKMGFGVPIDQWLRGSLQDWADDLLSEQRIKAQGLFDYESIRAEWELHRTGRKDRHYGLWTVLMFQAWYDIQGNRR
jgi:asparagine synthase (glutamine-hydrolysing)